MLKGMEKGPADGEPDRQTHTHNMKGLLIPDPALFSVNQPL